MDAVLIALAGVLLASAQFQVETTLQSVAVQVTDKQGNSIPGLQAADFTLLEDGRPQKIAFFAAGHEPISMAILLDMGRTMDFGGRMDRSQALLAPLLHRAHADDEVFVVPFTDEIGGLGHRGSAVYDALAAALCRMRQAKNVRQAVVVVTGGLDQDSRLNLDQLLQLVGSSRPQVFMVGLFDKPTYRIYNLGHEKVTLTGLRKVDNPLFAFRQFARESGAEAFFPSSESDLEDALKRISAIVAGEYTLAYYPGKTDKTGKIEVKLARPGARVLARRTVRSGDARCLSPADFPHPWESRVSSGPTGIVYHETFSDPKSGWPESHDPNGDAHYAPRGYRLSRAVRLRDTLFPAAGEAANAGDCLIAAYGPWWTNFRATARIEAQPDPWWRNRREASGRRDPWYENSREPRAPDDTASGVGLVFNLMETGYYALILTSEGPDARAALIKGKWDGTRSFLVPPTPMALPSLDQQSAHTLSVEHTRGRIALSVDGRLIATVEDSSFPYGLVGFGVLGGGRLLVRDLTVEAVR